jgi:osmoprotectant transport system ATP-binding protein
LVDAAPVMVEVQGVEKTFVGLDGRAVSAVRGVTFGVARGETLCLLGTSGCGKTTTLRMINRLVEPSAGRVCVEGQDVRDGDPIALRRRIGYVIQRGGLFPHMTVEKNVGLLCELEGWPAARVRARVSELLELVNLPADTFSPRYPAELSGGQRQRVGVARALALDPPIVLMDEPFGALDRITRAQLHVEFEALQARVGKAIVLVTHDLSEAFALGDRVALMHEGRIVQAGTEAELREHPAHDFVREFLREPA